MSTHNIGFYEDLTKIIFELSSITHLISSAGDSHLILSSCLLLQFEYKPCHEKICFLHMRKQRRRSAAR